MKRNIAIIIMSISLILGGISLYRVYTSMKEYKEMISLIESEKYENGKLTSVNMDKEISYLKEQNKALYDSVKKYKDDVKYVIQFKYLKEYKTDTVYVKDTEANEKVNVYSYENEENDSIQYQLNIGSIEEPNWYSLNFKLKDEFTIINRNNNNVNHTTIESANGGLIDNTTIFNKKEREKWIDNWTVGFSVGGGYGFTSHKIDIWIGPTLTWKF